MRSHRVLAALGLATLVAGAFACVAAPEDDAASSDAAHTAAHAVEENRPEYWAETTYAEHEAQMASFGAPLDRAVPDDDPLNVRMQAWLDRIDALVRADVLRTSGKPLAAPRPIAKVLASQTQFNAWVSPAAACLGAPLGSGPSTAPMALLYGEAVFPLSTTCAAPGWDRAEYARFWNAAKLPCRLGYAGESFSVTGATCQIDESAKHAANVAVMATSPFIHISTDYLSIESETSFVATLTHELGHYYMAHTTAKGAARFGYWYHASPDVAGTPERAPDAAELQAAYEEAVQGVAVERIGRTFSARLRPFLLATVHPLLAAKRGAEAGFPCARAVDALSPADAARLAEPSAMPTPEARAGYEAFERELAACAPRVALTGVEPPSSISAGAVLEGAKRYAPGKKAKVTLRLGDSLGDFVARLDATAKDLDAKAERVLAQARANGLGLYTVEQAADELGLELAVRLGFTADEVLASWLEDMGTIEALYRRAGVPVPPGESADACKTLYDAGFTTVDASGRHVPTLVPLGRLEEPHHSSCYRLFNMWREARAHRYVPGPKPAPLDPPWETLRARAVELTATAPPPAPPAPPPSSGTDAGAP